MKKQKLLIVIFITLTMGLSAPSYALDGQGDIEEIQVCTGYVAGWRNAVIYKLSDGNWFGIYGNYANGSNSDYDDTHSMSLVMFAFAQKLPLSVRATYSTRTVCGVTAAFVWDKKDDYIKIVRQ